MTLDIKNCFEALPHRLFLPVIKTRVDAATFSLIKMFLSSGNPIGIIQGNPLSPLLCNVALSDFDRQMNQLDKNLAQWRYADDLLLGALDPQAAIRGLAFAVHHLAELGLRMHPDKLVISTAQQGIDWLGVRMSIEERKAGKRRARYLVSRAVIEDMKKRVIKVQTIEAGKKVSLNKQIRSWVAGYPIAENAERVTKEIEAHSKLKESKLKRVRYHGDR